MQIYKQLTEAASVQNTGIVAKIMEENARKKGSRDQNFRERFARTFNQVIEDAE